MVKKTHADREYGSLRLVEAIVTHTLCIENVQHELVQSTQMDAPGQFAGGVAHAYKNTLMIGGGGMAARKKLARLPRGPPDQKRLVEWPYRRGTGAAMEDNPHVDATENEGTRSDHS
jgi:hypothetical protein